MDMQVRVVTATSSSAVDTPDGRGLMVWSDTGEVLLIRGLEPTPTRGFTAKQFKCPECGVDMSSPVKLGLHRRREHGVQGKQAKAAAAKKGKK